MWSEQRAGGKVLVRSLLLHRTMRCLKPGPHFGIHYKQKHNNIKTRRLPGILEEIQIHEEHIESPLTSPASPIGADRTDCCRTLVLLADGSDSGCPPGSPPRRVRFYGYTKQCVFGRLRHRSSHILTSHR